MTHADSLSADRAALADGLDVNRRGPGEVVRLMRVLHDIARQAIDAKSVAPLMDYLYASMDGATRRIAYVPVACAIGCSHCCHGFVAATAAEVLHVVKRLDAARLSDARAGAAAMAARTRDRTADERARMVTACPLLANNLCVAYDARPIACRTAASIRADICERAHLKLSGEDIPRPLAYTTLRRAYFVAYAGALKRAGLVWRPYEYFAALDFALNADEAEADWLAGKDIFRGLPEDLGGDPFADPALRQVYDAAFG